LFGLVVLCPHAASQFFFGGPISEKSEKKKRKNKNPLKKNTPEKDKSVEL